VRPGYAGFIQRQRQGEAWAWPVVGPATRFHLMGRFVLGGAWVCTRRSSTWRRACRSPPRSCCAAACTASGREEKLKAREQAKAGDAAYHAQMERLYRQHVLKDDPNVIPLGSLRRPTDRVEKTEKDEEVPA
jgi:hypothetical protein